MTTNPLANIRENLTDRSCSRVVALMIPAGATAHLQILLVEPTTMIDAAVRTHFADSIA